MSIIDQKYVFPSSLPSKQASKQIPKNRLDLPPPPLEKKRKEKIQEKPGTRGGEGRACWGGKKKEKKKKAGIYGFDQRKSEHQGEGGR